MIGNAYPWRNTGFVILEEGDIDPLTLSLKISQFRVTDKYGKPVAEGFCTLEEAGLFIDQIGQEVLDNFTGNRS